MHILNSVEAQPNLAEISHPTQHGAVETVAAILKRKGRQVWSIEPDATVFAAISLMSEKSVGALVVLSGMELVGIVSERDYARRVILQGRSSKEALVREIMSSPVITVPSGNTVHDCLRVMNDRRIRHLPVVDQDRLSGMLSIGDLVRAVLSIQAHTIDQLQTYITNSYPK